jgi:hypothetical protein
MARSTIVPLAFGIQCIQFHPSTGTRVLCSHFDAIFAFVAIISFGNNVCFLVYVDDVIVVVVDGVAVALSLRTAHRK